MKFETLRAEHDGAAGRGDAGTREEGRRGRELLSLAEGGPGVDALLDRETIDRFETDGVAILPAAIDAGWVERLQHAVERDIAEPGPFFHGYASRGGRVHGTLRLWEHDETFAEYCLRGPLPRLAAE